MKTALAWASSHIDNSWLTRHTCCCAAEDPQGKCDLTSPTDWDTYDGPIGHVGPLSEPVVVAHRSVTFGGTASASSSSPRLAGASRGNSIEEEAGCSEVTALRELMKQFVRELVHGKSYLVVIEHGQTEPCMLSLSQNLMCFQLEAAGVNHEIPLKNVKDVCAGRHIVSKAAPVTLDDFCSTLVLRSNECVTFRLRSLRERDEFTKCIKVLALSMEQ